MIKHLSFALFAVEIPTLIHHDILTELSGGQAAIGTYITTNIYLFLFRSNAVYVRVILTEDDRRKIEYLQ